MAVSNCSLVKGFWINRWSNPSGGGYADMYTSGGETGRSAITAASLQTTQAWHCDVSDHQPHLNTWPCELEERLGPALGLKDLIAFIQELSLEDPAHHMSIVNDHHRQGHGLAILKALVEDSGMSAGGGRRSLGSAP